MKKFLGKFVALVMTVSVLATCLAGCNNNKGPVANSSTVNLDINPNIDLVVNKDNKVVSVVANNDDAEKLLVNANVVGKDVDGAVNTIVGLSVELGYISEENDDVKVLAVDAKGKVNTKMMENIAKNVEETAKAKGAEYIKAIQDVTNSANRKLEKAKEELKASSDKELQKAADKLTAAKLHLVEVVVTISDGEIAFEEAVKMSVEELNQYIYDLSLQVSVVAEGALTEIKLKTAEAVAEVEAQMTAEYKKALNLSAQAALGAKTAYVDSCNGLIKALNKANELVQQSKEDIKVAPKYNPETYAPVVDALAEELFTVQADKDAFKRDATDKSVNHYTYKATLKALENAYDRVDKNNLTAEGLAGASIATKLDELETTYAEQIKNIKATAESAIATAQLAVKTAVNGVITAVNVVNPLLGLDTLAQPEKEFTTFDQLVVFCVDTITAQVNSVEKAFADKYLPSLNDDQKAAVAEYQTAIDNAKQTAIEKYEAQFKPQAA